MAHILKPPTPITIPADTPAIFLAGSIEQGQAVDWQHQVELALVDEDCVLFNPRRDEWDASWPEDINFEPFREQVEWELDALERADLIGLNFVPGTRSPISLLELGLHARRGRLVVCCPPGYWKKGNVDVVCQRYQIPQVDNLADLIAALQSHLHQLKSGGE
jgi:hypothetical protein